MVARARLHTTRRRLLIGFAVLAAAAAGALVYVTIASATVTITAGSATATADQANAGTYVTVSDITIAEGSNGDFGGNVTGTWGTTNVALAAPSGWNFDTTNSLTTANGGLVISGGNLQGATLTYNSATQLTLTLTGSGRNTSDSVKIVGLKVKATATTPLPPDRNITASSVNLISGVSVGVTNFATLTETAGAVSQLAVTAVPGSNVTAATNFSVTVGSQDAYGNTQNVTNTTGVSLAVNTHSGGGSAGTLSGNTGTIAAGGSSAVLSSVQYTKAETITLTAARTSGDSLSTSAASGNVTVVAGAFVKLQILLPGETADPGTASGKTGTVTAQTAGTSFNGVVVKAVDANWNPVSSTDTVGLSSNDPNPTLPANAALSAGTVTFNSLTLRKATSTATITATDISDGTKTADTSSNLTVNAGAFAKLQILLPGETAAPGTASGKTGTPSAQTVGSSFSGVVVNAVDANWNPVSSTHTVGLSSNDPNPTLPANAALSAGTVTFNSLT
ncbi:MAG: hypothetical protein M3P41_10635, partial [Actinomycetota bacterium]|nr:hypothetical protein [Actinomycetota bacterium]